MKACFLHLKSLVARVGVKTHKHTFLGKPILIIDIKFLIGIGNGITHTLYTTYTTDITGWKRGAFHLGHFE